MRPKSLDRYAATIGDWVKLLPASGGLCDDCGRPFLAAESDTGDKCPNCERWPDNAMPYPRVWMRPEWVIMRAEGSSGGIPVGLTGPRSNDNWVVSWWDCTTEDHPVLWAGPSGRRVALRTCRSDETVVKCHRTEDGGLYFPALCRFVSLADLRRMAGRNP